MVEVASKVDVSYQDELWIGREDTAEPGTYNFTQILGIEALPFPEKVPEDIDTTHLQSPGRSRETIPGLLAAADYSMEKQFWVGEAFETMLDELAGLTEVGTPEYVMIEFKIEGGAVRRTYRGYVNHYTPAPSIGDKRMVTLAMKIFNRVLPDPRADGGV